MLLSFLRKRLRFDYKRLKLSPGQIAAGDFKEHLGGGAAHWDRRGEFQLELLRYLGLQQDSQLLDFGCGPLRGGIHFLRFLQPGHYRGVDFNESFIAAAHRTLDEAGMGTAKTHVTRLGDFDFSQLHARYDYILCFSVLNHCNAVERALFFERVPAVMDSNTRLVITHAGWFRPQDVAQSQLRVTRAIYAESDLPAAMEFRRWGFRDGPATRLPMLQLGLDATAQDHTQQGH
jgi:cyclopropane fatty-acyl-phospholipid synthase-like methyltransferase